MCLCVMCFVCWFCIFFFFKQKTAYEMRISDWSSDVCSSDLYTEKEPDALGLATDGFVDPFHHATLQRPSYGVQSRLDYRALVVEGRDGQRVALVKGDRKSTRLNSSH